MIERLEGDLLELGSDHAVIGLGGIGIRVRISRPMAESLAGESRAALWTRIVIRDGEPHLFGFADSSERACFDSLIGVNGVGARIAMAILSVLRPSELMRHVALGTVEPLIAVQGVGRKLAQRILLELRGRLPEEPDAAACGAEPEPGAGVSVDAVRALAALGYPHAEAREAVRLALRESPGESPPLDQVVRQALLRLNRAAS